MRISSHLVSSEVRLKLDELFSELGEIGIQYVGHGVITKEGAHTGYFSDDQWGKHYIDKGYFFFDPVLQVFDQIPLKVIDWVVVSPLIKENKIFSERRQCTGIVSGLTLVSWFQNCTEFLNLGFSKEIPTTEYLLQYHGLLKRYGQIFRHYHTCQYVLGS